MAFTFGFYNSSNHDRMYDAEEFSRIFDGLITDGVYATIGNRFVVRAANEDNTIIVGSGRAWFKHSWSYNDTDMQMTGPASHALFNRWDAIVLDVNSETAYRTNSIIWITGDATSTPVKPTMIHTDKHNQYPLAYIYRPANNNAIPAVNITSCVGLDECPYTQGLVTDTKNIAPVENNDYASRAYKIGEYILWKNEFYKVTTAIAKNARIIPKPTSGYNITRSTIAEELYKTFTLDTVPTGGHYTQVVSSDGIYRALGNRSIIQTSAPASGSNNLITAGQVYTALGNKTSIDLRVRSINDRIICLLYTTNTSTAYIEEIQPYPNQSFPRSLWFDNRNGRFMYYHFDKADNKRPNVSHFKILLSAMLPYSVSYVFVLTMKNQAAAQRYANNILHGTVDSTDISNLETYGYRHLLNDYKIGWIESQETIIHVGDNLSQSESQWIIGVGFDKFSYISETDYS